MRSASGYSATPLTKKLRIKEGFVIRLVNEPSHYFDLFDDWPAQVTIANDRKSKKNFIHFFTTKAKELFAQLPVLRTELVAGGMIWVSWPKIASKVLTDIQKMSSGIMHWVLG